MTRPIVVLDTVTKYCPGHAPDSRQEHGRCVSRTVGVALCGVHAMPAKDSRVPYSAQPASMPARRPSTLVATS